MISNIPVSSQSLFKVPITYLYNPDTAFFTLIFTGMTQRVTFRESDDLRVRIFLPNGEIIKFEQPDSLIYFPGYRFPIPSDPLKQIQMKFELVRYS